MKEYKEYVVSCERMKELERLTDEAGLSYPEMMENAGRAAADRILGDWDKIEATGGSVPAKTPSALIYCGKGNNGGDGFVVARLLRNKDWNVEIVMVDGEPATPDAILNFDRAKAMEIPMVHLEQENGDRTAFAPDVVVDAVYGTGFHGRLRPAGAKTAEEIAAAKEAGAKVYALDIPSGMGGDLTDENELDPRCVTADVTITFHGKKPVHLQDFARKYCGEIQVADIGIIDPDRDLEEEAEGASAEYAEGDPHDFADFVGIVARLRGPGGCVWDRAQTHESLKKYFREETDEALEAIDNEDFENLCEELGDVLLQIVLHARIAEEEGHFDMADVIQGISDKMIRRHPWVFGDVEIDTIDENVSMWEEIKKKEKEGK